LPEEGRSQEKINTSFPQTGRLSPFLYIKEKNYEMTQFCGVIAEKNYLYMKKENEEIKNG